MRVQTFICSRQRAQAAGVVDAYDVHLLQLFLQTERVFSYVREFSPTNRPRIASLPELEKSMRQNLEGKCLDLFCDEISLKTFVIVAIFCSSRNRSH